MNASPNIPSGETGAGVPPPKTELPGDMKHLVVENAAEQKALSPQKDSFGNTLNPAEAAKAVELAERTPPVTGALSPVGAFIDRTQPLSTEPVKYEQQNDVEIQHETADAGGSSGIPPENGTAVNPAGPDDEGGSGNEESEPILPPIAPASESPQPGAKEQEQPKDQKEEAVMQQKAALRAQDRYKRLDALEQITEKNGEVVRRGLIPEEEKAGHFAKAGLYREEQARLNSRLENETLLAIANGTDQSLAADIAKTKGFGTVDAMRQSVTLQLRFLDAQDALLERKEDGKTLRRKMEEWAERIDNLSKTPSDEQAVKEAKYANDRLKLERQLLNNETNLKLALEMSETDQKKFLAQLGYKSDEKDTALKHLKDDVEKSRKTKANAKETDNEHKLAHPTFRGAVKELHVLKGIREAAKEEIKKIQNGEGRYAGLTGEQKLAEIAKQNDTITTASKQGREMWQYVLGVAGKRALIIWLLLQIIAPLATFVVTTKIVGKMLGVKSS